jgi:hypothetical protein
MLDCGHPDTVVQARVEVEMIAEIGLAVHSYGIASHFSNNLTDGASGASYQSSWGMAIMAAYLLDETLKKKHNSPSL